MDILVPSYAQACLIHNTLSYFLGSKSSKYRYLAMDCPAWEVSRCRKCLSRLAAGNCFKRVVTLLTLMLQEAAIYVKEGEDNDKFYSHPNDKRSKLAYAILHHHGYNLVCLLVCVGLLFLTLFEEPAAIGPQQRQNETGGENDNRVKEFFHFVPGHRYTK